MTNVCDISHEASRTYRWETQDGSAECTIDKPVLLVFAPESSKHIVVDGLRQRYHVPAPNFKNCSLLVENRGNPWITNNS